MEGIPSARVVRDGLRVVASAPRRIPAGLWVRVVFGGGANQSAWGMVALIAWIFGLAFLGSSASDEDDDLLTILLGATFIFMCATMLVGIYFLKTRLQLRLLRRGLPVQGTLIGVTKPGPDDEKVTNEYTFRYVVDDGAYEVTVTTTFDAPRLEDEATETLLYLPERPAKALPLDYLPGFPRIDSHGELVARNRLWPVLALPLVGLAGIVTVLLAW